MPLRWKEVGLAIWPNHFLTQVMSPSPASDVSSEHTPINDPSRRNGFNIENDLATTAAASENSDGFHVQAAASGGPQLVPGSVVYPWLSADMWSSTRKPVRGNASNASREERETEIWKVRKLCLKGEFSMSTWSRKLNWRFKENAQIRDDYLRLKQTWA